MWLHVCKASIEKRLGAFNRKRFNFVRRCATLVITLARIAFGIFVGEDGALGFKHRAADDVFRRDQFDLVLLPRQLVLDGIE